MNGVVMQEKIRRPKVKLPGVFKDYALMSAVRNGGKIDRTYIRLMCSAVHTHEQKRNENLRKINKDLSSDE